MTATVHHLFPDLDAERLEDSARLADHRRGRTTVVVSASPLVLSVADEVVLLDGGSVVARGRHHDLVRGDAAYRAVVVRGEDAKVTA